MRISHKAASVFVSSLLAISFLVGWPANTPRAQDRTDPTTTRAIQLYEQGNAPEAIKLLKVIVHKHPDDADAWYYLGLALNREGLISQARPAFEKFVELRPDSADAHAKLAFALILNNDPIGARQMALRALELGDQSPEAHYAIAEASLRTGAPAKALEEADATLKIDPNFAPALITRSFAHYNLQQFSEAATSLERFLAMRPDDMDAETWRGQLEELSNRPSQPSNPLPEVFKARDVTQKVRVTGKPEPQYTEPARKAGVTGTVILQAIFSADGQVSHIKVIRALGYGLTTQAVKAARRIKFEPANKDGRPVSMFMMLEYNFNLY